MKKKRKINEKCDNKGVRTFCYKIFFKKKLRELLIIKNLKFLMRL